MRRSAAIVIIGGGIVGCGAAYFLTRLGWRDVVVLEQGPLFETGGSTSHAPGLVFQTNPSKTMTGFARETVALYATLESDGEPCWYGVGSLEVASTRERWQDLHRKLGWARSWGLDACLLSADATADKLPLIDPSRIHGAYYVPSDGIARAARACEAMARSAQASGATFYERTPVVGIEVERGQVRGVELPSGRIATDRVLVCAGIWGPRVARLAGVSIPLAPVEHQLAWTTPLPELAGATAEAVHPILRHQDKDLYFRQRRDHYAVGSYQHEPVVVAPEAIRRHGAPDDMPASRPFTAETFAPVWLDAVDLLPALSRTTIAEAFNGMFSFTPDGFPLLGESGQVRGLWVAEAIWITHAGGAAKTVAEWLTAGRPAVDVHECDVNRFEPHATTPAYVRARGAQQYREVYDVIHPLQPMEQPRPLRTSPFYERQHALGAVFAEGRGWEQPRWFEGNRGLLDEYRIAPRAGWAGQFWSPIAGAEHLATRERVALFDMTPLAKLDVSGPGATRFLDAVTTNRIDRPIGTVTYALLLDERGGIRSDLTIARLGEEEFRLGANGPLDLVWLRRHLPPDGSVQVRDVTGALCCLGVWGPRARDVIQMVSDDQFGNDSFPYYSARRVTIGEVPVVALRISYVGEFGWELYASPEFGGRLWDLLWEAGRAHGMIAAGRAAFDTLRLEKGYRLSGVDLRTEHDPFESGLAFAVKLGKPSFIGRDALLAARALGVQRRLCCLTLDDPAVVVMGKEPIVVDDRVVGYVTSAGFGYSVGRSIAFGYLPAGFDAEGTLVEIEYFGARCPATVAIDPLFDPRGERLRA